MPNYNDAATLPAAVQSLAAQTVAFDRILVIDDGSNDHSMAVLRGLQASVPQLEIVENGHNLGVIATMNHGLSLAREDYVFFASANDVFAPDALAHAKEALRAAAHPVGLIGGKTRLVSAEGAQVIAAPLPDHAAGYDAARYAAILRRRNFSFYGCSSFLHRAQALAAGGFKPALEWHTDWLLMAALCARHGFAYSPHVVGHMQLKPGQYSQSIHDWGKQRHVIRAYLHTLKQEYADLYALFRSVALLPSYDVQALPLILRDAAMRDYLTPLLLWRLVSYKPMRAVGRLLPRGMREKLRGWLRV